MKSDNDLISASLSRMFSVIYAAGRHFRNVRLLPMEGAGRSPEEHRIYDVPQLYVSH